METYRLESFVLENNIGLKKTYLIHNGTFSNETHLSSYFFFSLIGPYEAARSLKGFMHSSGVMIRLIEFHLLGMAFISWRSDILLIIESWDYSKISVQTNALFSRFSMAKDWSNLMERRSESTYIEKKVLSSELKFLVHANGFKI